MGIKKLAKEANCVNRSQSIEEKGETARLQALKVLIILYAAQQGYVIWRGQYKMKM